LAGLGGIGRAEDAPVLAAYLEASSALLREVAAAALGRMGDAARGEIRKALRSRLPRTRALACIAAARSGEPSALLELKAAFRDKDEEVRRTALAALLAVQPPLRAERKAFKEEVTRLLSDQSPSVRLAARRALAD
ncbi:MAG: HEAT repeat domain-containing protein, partial [Elusimicrobiota bacterium]